MSLTGSDLQTRFDAIHDALAAQPAPDERERLKQQIIALFRDADAAATAALAFKASVKELVERWKQLDGATASAKPATAAATFSGSGRVDHLGIANILLKRQAWPEYLQGACEPAPLAARLRECVETPGPRSSAVADAGELLRMLSAQSGSTPAEWVATFLPK